MTENIALRRRVYDPYITHAFDEARRDWDAKGVERRRLEVLRRRMNRALRGLPMSEGIVALTMSLDINLARYKKLHERSVKV